MYRVAKALVTIPASFQRLKKFGYCGIVEMKQVWKFAVPTEAEKITAASGEDSKLPILYTSLIKDDIKEDTKK